MSGVGGKSFCAGGDIVSIYKLWKDGRSLPELLKFFEVEY
jgi:enoyl-CoA hydratase/carnithine racemase